ncbi:MAG: (d)CMP kinase [Clostridiales bacterium]|nr:(d)CMP kinase [Clostridiales bacterium]
MKMKIAIDGPAGAGKSTISKETAKRLGFIYIDTGAMYRSVGLAALNAGVSTTDEEQLGRIISDIDISIKNVDNTQRFYLCGEDVTEKIREPEVSVAASNVAVVPAVRLKLVELQRRMAENADVLMDGRDIGTYVLPNAELKIFLTASVDERARRRYEELCSKNVKTTLEAVKNDIIYRDKNDSEREFAPLKPAPDSVLLDTTDMTVEEVINKILNLIKERRNVII